MRHYPALALLFVIVLFISALPVAADDSYTVQPGDNLYRIALRHGLTVDELAHANGITDPHRLYVGQVLLIPDSGAEESATEAAATEPLLTEAAAEVTATSSSLDGVLTAVQATRAQAEAVVARQEALAEVAVTEHVVQAGETLTQISQRYGVTTSTLIRLNNLAAPNVIYPGQRLRIPLSGEVVPPEPLAPAAGSYKQIIVDKSEQRAYVYQDRELLWTFIISTGMAGSETWEGTFQVRSKIPNAYAYNWGLQMPYWLGFYHTGYLENGFHALPIMSSGAVLWDGYLGTPVSYGCVILSYPDAEILYQWAEIGTEVVVRP